MSTNFNIGYDATRSSSKVLKPPGGGSSDIFGLGNSHASTNGTVTEKSKTTQVPANSKERLFGDSNNIPSSPAKTYRMQSNLFGNDNEVPSKSAKKKFVHRNPITGEEIEIDPEKYQKTENEDKNEEEENTDEVPSVPSRHVQTSIRVRNPPGGKSSGIF